MFKGIIDDPEKSDIKVVVIDLKPYINYRAMIHVFSGSLRDPSMTELLYKEYRILGRVVGKFSDDHDAVNLLHGTGLSSLDPDVLEQMFAGFQIGALPKPETKVKGPVVQVLPIAIYV